MHGHYYNNYVHAYYYVGILYIDATSADICYSSNTVTCPPPSYYQGNLV